MTSPPTCASSGQREIETNDDEWVRRTVSRIEADRNYMIEDAPNDVEVD